MSGFLNLEGIGTEAAEDALIIGPSMLENWLLCNYRELYRNEEWYDNRSSAAAGFGTGMHALIERFLKGEGQPKFSGEAMQVWIEAMATHPKHPETITQYASNSDLLFMAKEMLAGFELWLETWYEQEGKGLTIITNELTLRRPLGRLPSGREVWIEGTADTIAALSETAAMGYDWKTAGRGWKRGKAEGRAQHTVYGWLAEPVVAPSRVVQATYVVYNRQSKEWTWQDKRIMLNTNMTAAVLKMMWDMAVGLDAEIGTASPHTRGGFGDGRGWHCKAPYCGAWNGCPFKHMIDDQYLDQDRPTEMKWSV